MASSVADAMVQPLGMVHTLMYLRAYAKVKAALDNSEDVEHPMVDIVFATVESLINEDGYGRR